MTRKKRDKARIDLSNVREQLEEAISSKERNRVATDGIASNVAMDQPTRFVASRIEAAETFFE